MPTDEMGIVLAEDVQDFDDKYEGRVNVTPDISIVKHNYMGRIFEKGDDRFQELVSMVVIHRGGIRRNYESDYNPSKIIPPHCYSVDGVQGSRPAEVKKLQNVDRKVYGECQACFYSKFKTAGIWKGEPRPGVQCGEYALVFLVQENGQPAVMQIPPTSCKPVKNGMESFLAKKQGASLSNIWWKFLPAGGGKKGDSISVVPFRGATREEMIAIKQARSDMNQWIEGFISNFASGGGEEAEPIKASSSEI